MAPLSCCHSRRTNDSMAFPLELESADGCAVVLPPLIEAHAAAVPPKADSGDARKPPTAHNPADAPVNYPISLRAAHEPPRKPADVPVGEPEDTHRRSRKPSRKGAPVAEPSLEGELAADESAWPTPGQWRPSVPVGLVYVQNLGDIETLRSFFVMALHITRVSTCAGDLFGISATKDWGATLNGRWLSVGNVKSDEMSSHAKTWWRLGNPQNNPDLLWKIVAHDQYFSICSASKAITRGGWLYAPLPEVDHGHRRVLTWTQEGDPSEDVDMRWTLLTDPGQLPKPRARSQSRSILISDVSRWKDISEPKSTPRAVKDGAGAGILSV